MTYYYHAYALTIASALPLPELSRLTTPPADVAVSIEWGAVDPEGLSAPVYQHHSVQVSPQQLWLVVPQVARFLVIDGRQIIIDPLPGSDQDSIRVFLLGSCLGTILLQRGFTLLHGNAVRVGQGVVIFSGVSGAGKSTLAGFFYKRGHAMLADDVCAITKAGEVIPGFPQLKVWADTAQQLELEKSTLRRIRPHLEKYALPLTTQFCSEQLPLKAVYILETHANPHIEFIPHRGTMKYQQLRAQMYRPQIANHLLDATMLWQTYATLAEEKRVVQVKRPHIGSTIDALAHRMELDWRQNGFL